MPRRPVNTPAPDSRRLPIDWAIVAMFARIPSGAVCSFCGGREPLRQVQVDMSTDGKVRTFRFFCTVACEASWGTNQPTPGEVMGPPARGLFG